MLAFLRMQLWVSLTRRADMQSRSATAVAFKGYLNQWIDTIGKRDALLQTNWSCNVGFVM